MESIPTVRGLLDELVAKTIYFDKVKIPPRLFAAINSWKWGEYGWVSPASLIFTAAWRKHFYPEQDCCKIWAKDEKNNAIPGSYSIRSEDEGVSIPVLAKYDLCRSFCSDNSGMQGARSIEKMRSLKRLGANFSESQKTLFDLKLFATILNEINKLSKDESLEVIKLIICNAKRIQAERQSANLELKSTKSDHDILGLLETVADPELTKCVAAACLDSIYGAHGLKLSGVTDHKTAADARAEKPGDLALSRGQEVIISAEVKDRSVNLDWQNITRAEQILRSQPSIVSFIFIMGNRAAVSDQIVREMVTSGRLSLTIGRKITFVSLHDLYIWASSIVGEATLRKETGKYLSEAPSVKAKTKDIWLKRR